MEKRFNLFLILVYVAVVVVCYAASLNGEFLWDDDYLIKLNPLVRAPIFSFAIFKQDIVNSGFNTTIYYRPIQILSYALDYRVWKGFDPWGFHFTGLLLHLLNGFLVFLFTRKLTRDKTIGFLAGFIFLIHPAFSGCISYVSSRADLLFFFFGFLSMMLFARFRETEKRDFLTGSVACLILSMLSREGAVIFPVLILMMDVFYYRKKGAAHFFAHIPGFVLAAVYLLVHHLMFSDRYSSIVVARSFFGSMQAFGVMLLRYFVLAFFPIGMHARPVAYGAGMFAIAAFSGSSVLIAVAFMYLKEKRRDIAFGIAFFLIAMMPMFFVVGYFNVFANHWLYLPGYGLFFLFSTIFVSVYKKVIPAIKILLGVLLFGIILFYVMASSNQTGFWSDDVSLSDHVLASSEKDVNAMHFKAVSLIQEGKETEALNIIDEYAESNSSEPRSWYIKGRMYLVAKKPAEAEEAFASALKVSGVYDNGYLGMGLVAAYRGDTERAAALLERAVELNPYNYEALTFLGALYSKSGDNMRALDSAMRLKRVNPYSLNAIINMGTAYSRVGRMGFAAQEYLRAVTLYPEEPKAYYNLAYTFYASGELSEAEKWARKCLKVDPSFKPAMELLLELKQPAT